MCVREQWIVLVQKDAPRARKPIVRMYAPAPGLLALEPRLFAPFELLRELSHIVQQQVAGVSQLERLMSPAVLHFERIKIARSCSEPAAIVALASRTCFERHKAAPSARRTLGEAIEPIAHWPRALPLCPVRAARGVVVLRG